MMNVSLIQLIAAERRKNCLNVFLCVCVWSKRGGCDGGGCICLCVCVSLLAHLPGYMFIISRLPGFDAYLESNLISSGHYYMSGHEKDTHTRQRNISGPGGAIYLSPSRFKILIKINLTQFTHSAICLFIRIMLITSVGQKNYYPFCA